MRGVPVGTGKRGDQLGQRLATWIAGLLTSRGLQESNARLEEAAHHLTIEGGKRSLMIAALRYYDTFVKVDGSWLFSERLL